MTYVITQSCCNDASCVVECPVDCIRPVPGDPDFVSAEMLYIDPDSCIDCGACQDACPVGAVYPEDDVPDHLAHFVEFNADYFLRHPLESAPTAVEKPEKPDNGTESLQVAIVGSGPAAAYLADDLIARGNVKVNVFEKLPTPWGLLRSGVAPDHLSTKNLSGAFERTLRSPNFEYILNVDVGTDISVDELRASHHAVVIATGAADPQPWDVPGADLTGVHPATDFVGWYNGHPECADLHFDLSCERVVIVGNGNVALDAARILTMDPESLKASDIAEHARQALSDSKVREVVILGRRGVLQAAYTAAELAGLAHLTDVDLVIDPVDAVLDPESQEWLENARGNYFDELKFKVSSRVAATLPRGATRRIVLRFLVNPLEVLGDDAVTGVLLGRNELILEDQVLIARPSNVANEVVPTGMVLTSIGYRGRAMPGVPYDAARGTIPQISGRIDDAERGPLLGLYTTGWAKRGAHGGIGAGRPDAQETADAIVADFNAGLLTSPKTASDTLLAERGVKVVTAEGWRAIDQHERHLGSSLGRPRHKLVRIDEMLAIALAGGSSGPAHETE